MSEAKFSPRIISPESAAQGYNNEGRGKLVGYISDPKKHEKSCPHRKDAKQICACRIGLWQDEPPIHGLAPLAPTSERVEIETLDQDPAALEAPKKKPCYIGAPAIFALEQACKSLNDAFGGFHCYLVGSATERQDWRDVDVRYILSDADFALLFPGVEVYAAMPANWEFDNRWIWLCTSISDRLAKLTGLPIDFQFQPQTFANECHDKRRHPLGLNFKKAAGA